MSLTSLKGFWVSPHIPAPGYTYLHTVGMNNPVCSSALGRLLPTSTALAPALLQLLLPSSEIAISGRTEGETERYLLLLLLRGRGHFTRSQRRSNRLPILNVRPHSPAFVLASNTIFDFLPASHPLRLSIVPACLPASLPPIVAL